MWLIEEFLSSTSIHGFQYLMGRRNKIIKFGWFLLILGGIIYSFSIIKDSFDDWEANPVITTVSKLDKSITGIEYPALTLCDKYQGELKKFGIYKSLISLFPLTKNAIKDYKSIVDSNF